MRIKARDTVRIVDKPRWGGKVRWLSGMTMYCGQEAEVVKKLGVNCSLLDIDEGYYIWSDDFLIKTEEAGFDMKGFSELLRL